MVPVRVSAAGVFSARGGPYPEPSHGVDGRARECVGGEWEGDEREVLDGHVGVLCDGCELSEPDRAFPDDRLR